MFSVLAILTTQVDKKASNTPAGAKLWVSQWQICHPQHILLNYIHYTNLTMQGFEHKKCSAGAEFKIWVKFYTQQSSVCTKRQLHVFWWIMYSYVHFVCSGNCILCSDILCIIILASIYRTYSVQYLSGQYILCSIILCITILNIFCAVSFWPEYAVQFHSVYHHSGQYKQNIFCYSVQYHSGQDKGGGAHWDKSRWLSALLKRSARLFNELAVIATFWLLFWG